MPDLDDLVRVAIVAAPGSEAITTAEARAHCDIPSADTTHDTYLDSLITAARQKWERDTDTVVMSSTAVEKLDEWPEEEPFIALTKRPVQSVTSVAYLDANGSSQTWSASNYSLDLYRPTPAIALAYNVQWPNSLDWDGSITITYVVGHANAAAVPKLWKQAMLLLIGHWFENRSAAVTGAMPHDAPITYERIAMNFRRCSYP
jgi:uncharacterized phiE125 gp8 family phage protein